MSDAMKKEVKLITAMKREAFESMVEDKLKEGFIFFPESFKVSIVRNGEFGGFAILMFRNPESLMKTLKKK